MLNVRFSLGLFLLGLGSCSAIWAAEASRDAITIVGSSTVYPFSSAVAEHFGKKGTFKTPKVESTGTGGGFKLFCGGVGPQYPDIANASRAMKASEFEKCQKAGVKEIIEIKIGFDGIVLAQSKKSKHKLKLTRKELFLALAKEVPNPLMPDSLNLIENPYKTWADINKSLPKTKIEVLGPPPTSGTRDAFSELVLESGCLAFPEIKAKKDQDEAWFKKVCMTVREDGAFVEAGENDNLIVQKLETNPNSVGIFGYSYLAMNEDRLVGAPIDGRSPTYEAIADGSYPVSRPLFIYVKKGNIGVIPGIEEYMSEYLSEKASGPEGYLPEKGLIALPESEHRKIEREAKAMTIFAPK
jgi:phosphate transport system substrate-binding protein